MNGFDTTTNSYRIALESFNGMALDQPPADRLRYRTIAMEAVTGPDSGMVLDHLYKSVMSRASINFGKIPDSMGDLTKFTKYKSLADNITLLERSLGEYNIKELKLTRELHDCLIRCREDFSYGFKVDSQFIKTTYNSMVYALCEMINLCDTIYVDMLKSNAEGRAFEQEDFSGLLLVQNVDKFVTMVKSGEWSSMMQTIKKDARNLVNIIYQDNGDGSLMHTLAGIVGTVGVPGAIMVGLRPSAKALAGGEAVKLSHYVAAGKNVITSALPKTKVGKGILIAVVSIIALLLLVRGVVSLYYKGVYKLNDVLDDNEKFLRAHIENNADTSGSSKSLEKQRAMYDKLAGLRDNMRGRIMKSDSEGRKMLKESNAKEFSAQSFKREAVADNTGDDDFAIM